VKPRTRLLGVDFGTVRIGLAVCDVDRRIASPLETYHRKNEEADRKFFQEVFEEEEIGGIVVGLPVHMSGDEGGKAKEARQLGEWLRRVTGLPVVYWDERFTSAEAEQFLQMAGLTRKKRKQRIDRVAAQILLQAYLDAGCPEKPEIGTIDADSCEITGGE
jgi:putative Holliday junction resolvase